MTHKLTADQLIGILFQTDDRITAGAPDNQTLCRNGRAAYSHQHTKQRQAIKTGLKATYKT